MKYLILKNRDGEMVGRFCADSLFNSTEEAKEWMEEENKAFETWFGGRLRYSFGE